MNLSVILNIGILLDILFNHLHFRDENLTVMNYYNPFRDKRMNGSPI